jgi:hypothetical protein
MNRIRGVARESSKQNLGSGACTLHLLERAGTATASFKGTVRLHLLANGVLCYAALCFYKYLVVAGAERVLSMLARRQGISWKVYWKHTHHGAEPQRQS